MIVNTIHGPKDDALLVKKQHAEGKSSVVEYYLDGELVHRSVEVRLTGMQSVGVAKNFH